MLQYSLTFSQRQEFQSLEESAPSISFLMYVFTRELQKQNMQFEGNAKLCVHTTTCSLNIKHTNAHGALDYASSDNEAR